jgi:hypothetical protein
MREAEVRYMQVMSAKRSMMLARQFSFLKCRQEALERVIKTASLWMRIRYLLNIPLFFKVWDGVTTTLINEEAKMMEDAAKKPKLEVVKTMPTVVLSGSNGHG